MSPPTVSPEELAALGWTNRWQALFQQCTDEAPGPLVPARVARVDRGAVVLLPQARPCPIRPGDSLAVGDWVAVDPQQERVVAVLERSGTLVRRDPDRDEAQPVAANVDLVLAVTGLDRPVRHGRVDRVTAQAWDAGAGMLAVLTKADLSDDVAGAVAELEALVPLVEVLATSVATGWGIDRLRERIAGRTVVLVCESGAGKSSLLNALVTDASAATGLVREGDAKGRHTTTRRELHVVGDGTVVIDTPGVRAMGLWLDADAVQATFADIDQLAASCRFRDCRHDGEPGCAVGAAVDSGDLGTERLEQFTRLRAESESLRVRRDRAARHAVERQFGKAIREAKRFDKRRRRAD